MEFFRFCPECNRRFHIKLVSKNRTKLNRQTIKVSRPANMGLSYSGVRTGRGAGMATFPPPVTTVYEGEPIVVEIEEFQYHYKCKHCGHEWSEKHIEKHREN